MLILPLSNATIHFVNLLYVILLFKFFQKLLRSNCWISSTSTSKMWAMPSTKSPRIRSWPITSSRSLKPTNFRIRRSWLSTSVLSCLWSTRSPSSWLSSRRCKRESENDLFYQRHYFCKNYLFDSLDLLVFRLAI